ncbi:caspase-7-like isoform X2 [Haemaphysalis longicornis]
MSALQAKDAARNGEEAKEVSQADAIPFDERLLGEYFPKSKSSDHPKLLTKLNDVEYHIRSGRRGKCVIFNYKTFQRHTNLKERTGTDEDVRQLNLQFRELGFEVIVHPDLTKARTEEVLRQLGDGDYTQDDCFVCWILTHGTEQSYLYTSDGGKMTGEKFMSPFRENRSLLGKPKLFFIQACRGAGVDQGDTVAFDSADSGATCRIPKNADFLVAYSTVPGFLSWRDARTGSWFVQAICCVLEKSTGSEDLLALLTEACRIVALFHEVDAPNDDPKNGAKQMPFVTSTLIRRVRFPKIRQT